MFYLRILPNIKLNDLINEYKPILILKGKYSFI